MLRTMTSEELSEWMAFYQREHEIHEERRRETALAADATTGLHDMRGKIRGNHR